MVAGAANAGDAIDETEFQVPGKFAQYAAGPMDAADFMTAEASAGPRACMLLAVVAMCVTWLLAAGGPMSVEESTGVQGVILLRSSDGSARTGGRSLREEMSF